MAKKKHKSDGEDCAAQTLARKDAREALDMLFSLAKDAESDAVRVW